MDGGVKVNICEWCVGYVVLREWCEKGKGKESGVKGVRWCEEGGVGWW